MDSGRRVVSVHVPPRTQTNLRPIGPRLRLGPDCVCCRLVGEFEVDVFVEGALVLGVGVAEHGEVVGESGEELGDVISGELRADVSLA